MTLIIMNINRTPQRVLGWKNSITKIFFIDRMLGFCRSFCTAGSSHTYCGSMAHHRMVNVSDAPIIRVVDDLMIIN